MSGYASARYDFPHPVPVRRRYVVASTYRSGSTHLCVALWTTGLMGAPWEYLNFEGDMQGLMARLGAASTADYVARLLALRTSANGVFGLKAHFTHFDAALRSFPQLYDHLRDAKFIYMSRGDVGAQAVSMAKALQTNAWLSLAKPRRVPLFYSSEFILACLSEIREQAEGWARWFETHDIAPLVADYETLLSEPQGTVDSIVRFAGVTPQAVAPINLVQPERQADHTNAEWLQRFADDAGEQSPLPLPRTAIFMQGMRASCSTSPLSNRRSPE
jgi:trehalose 2-sulfotransferase